MMSEKKAWSKNNTQNVKCIVNWMLHFWGKYSNTQYEMEIVQSQREITRPSCGEVTPLQAKFLGVVKQSKCWVKVDVQQEMKVVVSYLTVKSEKVYSAQQTHTACW